MQSPKKTFKIADPAFASELAEKTRLVSEFGETLQLCTMRRRALAKGWLRPPERTRRVAVMGGANLRPMVDFIEHFASILGGFHCETWVGEYDNYESEIVDPESPLYEFKPEVTLLLPSEKRCRYDGTLTAPRAEQESAGRRIVQELLELARTVHERTSGEVVLGNFRLPPHFDPGPLRHTSLTTEYAFRKFVNMELGVALPSYVHLCDIEFLANRRGTLESTDERTWFESKQPFASGLLVDVAREYAHVLSQIGVPPKKVVVLDLDNTLWGGVIGDDGLEGIELGTTSARGEAFRDFQRYLLELSRRGVLLAVCSKNDHETAVEPFEKHPEMVLRTKDFVCFKANWEPKPDSLRQIAHELNLGVDSLVFVDDNPAEIEIIRQFVPEVSTVWLGDDPAEFTWKLKDSRYFETRNLTTEDLHRSQRYKQDSERQQLLNSSADMESYLRSLEMVATIRSFEKLEIPRIAQLIQKSNQFNLTTRRRTDAEVKAVMASDQYSAFTVRLADRFGDHGLIAVVIGEIRYKDFRIDTWLMSCRVLKRQVEEEVMNEIVLRASEHGCSRIMGHYIPTTKNNIVGDLYRKLGFAHVRDEADGTRVYELAVDKYRARPTQIRVNQERYAATGTDG